MRIPRIYTHNHLANEQHIELEDKAHKHVKDVLRMKAGDHVILFNGDGNDYAATLVEVSKKKLCVEIQTHHIVNNESHLQIHLLQPLCGSEKMDLCLQKATELGAHSITPFVSNRVNMNIPCNRLEKKMAHWQSVIQSACEQSGRSQLPVINPLTEFSTAIHTAPLVDIKIIASPTANQQNNFGKEKRASCVCAIGPEGGFTNEEVQLSEQNGFKAIQIGPRILRLETAVISALTLCQFNWGDF